MQVTKTLKFRIYPTETQKVYFAKSMGCYRYIWNTYLAKNKELYENHQQDPETYQKSYLNYNAIASELPKLKEDKEWLKEVDSQMLQKSARNLHDTFSKFFKTKVGYPRFKCKGDDYSFPAIGYIKYIEETHSLKIPKLKEPIKLHISKRDHRKLKDSEINQVYITKSSSGKYHASISITTEQLPLPEINNIIGIDLGIRTLLTDSEGNQIENPKFLAIFENKIAYRNKQLAKKKKKSANRRKARKALAKTYEKLTNIRKNFLHKLTTQIVHENQVIICENLNVKDMIQKAAEVSKDLAKGIQNACLGEILRQLKYKSQWYGRTFHQVDRFYPSSQICSCCGYRNESLGSEESWTCSCCNTRHNRDKNAAVNIKREGLSNLGLWNIIPKQKPEEAPALAGSVIQEATHFSGW